MARKVTLSQPQNNWLIEFEAESSFCRKILGGNLISIYHVGSTSIPGIMAKPVVDLMPVVQSLVAVDDVKDLFLRKGYLYRGEHGIPHRRYIVGLCDEKLNHKVHIHIFLKDHQEIKRHLAFRDYLRKNLAVARQYEQLKIKLMKQYEFEREKYQEGKSKFCESVLKTAMGSMYCPPSIWVE